MVKVYQELYPKMKGNGLQTAGYYLNGFLQSNLDHVKKDVTKRNFDSFIIVTGREGFGKSTLAMQVAKYLDPTFDLHSVVFTANQFLEAVELADKYQAIVFDETMGYLSSRGAMSRFNKTLIKVMSEMRSKNLFIIMCIPNFFELDRYPAIHRSTGLLHVVKRGMFGSYDYRRKKNLYLFGRKSYSYNTTPNYTGDFTSFFPLEQKSYEEKKQAAINEYTQNMREGDYQKNQRNKLIYECHKNNLYDSKQLAKILGLSVRSVQLIVKECKGKAEM